MEHNGYDYSAFPTLTETLVNDLGDTMLVPILALCPSTDSECGGLWYDAVSRLHDGTLLRCGHVYKGQV